MMHPPEVTLESQTHGTLLTANMKDPNYTNSSKTMLRDVPNARNPKSLPI
jgi:hypothetical protein